MTYDNENTNLVYSFSEGEENIDGRYIRATHVREKGLAGYIICCMLFVIILVVYILILLNWQRFTFAAMWPAAASAGAFASFASVFAIPLGIFSVFFFPPMIVMTFFIIWPDGKGWSARNYAFAKWYGRLRSYQKDNDKEVRFYYFNTYMRTSMPVDVFDDRFEVYLPGGRMEVPYSQMYKTFIYRDLYIVRAFQKGKSWDIIIDLRSMGEELEKSFKTFMKTKKSEFLYADKVDEPWIKSSIFDRS